MVDHVIYDAYGTATQGAGFSTVPLPRFGYAGMRFDANAQLDYDTERWYHPSNGVFISQDPLGFWGAAWRFHIPGQPAFAGPARRGNILIAFAGPASGFILAVVLLVGLHYLGGFPIVPGITKFQSQIVLVVTSS